MHVVERTSPVWSECMTPAGLAEISRKETTNGGEGATQFFCFPGDMEKQPLRLIDSDVRAIHLQHLLMFLRHGRAHRCKACGVALTTRRVCSNQGLIPNGEFLEDFIFRSIRYVLVHHAFCFCFVLFVLLCFLAFTFLAVD